MSNAGILDLATWTRVADFGALVVQMKDQEEAEKLWEVAVEIWHRITQLEDANESLRNWNKELQVENEKLHSGRG